MLAIRLAELIVTLWGISTLIFLLQRISGDPAAVLAGPIASPEQIQRIRESLGLTAPLLIQYFRFLQGAAHLDFGQSFQYRIPAFGVVLDRVPASLELTGVAAAGAILLALPLGMLSARFSSRPLQAGTFGLALLGQSTPSFVLGVVLILIFAVRLRWFPALGNTGPSSLVLPAITLGLFLMARQMRLVRAYVIEELHANYIRTAEAHGLSAPWILLRHLLPNILPPVVALLGVDFGQFFAGAIITEAVFNWPGVGSLIVAAVSSRDYPVVQAGVFVIAVLVVLVNFGVNALQGMLDPRVRDSDVGSMTTPA